MKITMKITFESFDEAFAKGYTLVPDTELMNSRYYNLFWIAAAEKGMWCYRIEGSQVRYFKFKDLALAQEIMQSLTDES